MEKSKIQNQGKSAELEKRNYKNEKEIGKKKRKLCLGNKGSEMKQINRSWVCDVFNNRTPCWVGMTPLPTHPGRVCILEVCAHTSVSWRCVTLLLYPGDVLPYFCILEVCDHTSVSWRCVTLLLYPGGV